ncbi:hypothetical protein F4779DRAFT_368622 [Xylariaceae sp. FL0662B]|nr:hypothetical protein F4779DRAFT_368622 [Xylariaceae sp. FL0662B]
MMGSNVKTFKDANTFLFGGHVQSPTRERLDKRVHSLLEGPNAGWIKETVTGLSDYWHALTTKIPEVSGTISGSQQLAHLDSWLQHGIDTDETTPDENFPNAVVGTLLVAIQLDQYWRYLEIARHSKGLPCDVDLQADLVASQKRQQQPVVLGFCVGLLAALAVSSSANRKDFESYGAAAIRIGMLIGAIVDAREVWDKGLGKGKSISYATAWRGARQHAEMTRIISAFYPEAYISVLFDEARATVITSERTAPSLVRQLRAASLVVVEIGIEGHIHTPGPDRKRHTKALVELCREKSGLQFADASKLALPAYDNRGDGKQISPGRGDITEIVLESILMLQCNWYGTFSKIVANKSDTRIVSFGLDCCIPPSLLRRLGARQEHFDDIEKIHLIPPRNQTNGIVAEPPNLIREQRQLQPQKTEVPGCSPSATAEPITDGPRRAIRSSLGNGDPLMHDDSIVIVGMSIKVAGADDLDEFVDMLRKGESQHELITHDRLQHDVLHREKADADPKRKFYANFVRDSDAFDHKFFKRSPRESQAMDPQSRLCLEGAYQAVEQSGYFTETTRSNEARDKLHVGVYIGNCGVDYEQNIACNPATAFTATGGLRSFISGRLSHYFGWTGPSLTIDSACSSSTVAIHTACRNLLSDECSAALCGGVNIITSMLWMQNLAAGSFISPTGQCKPFDDAADGYCRAEGMAFVFLKKLSDAVADGNPILATIPSTAVYQNLNSTPLFVPNSPSLSLLFKDVMKAANVEANDISLVEAHGTGTSVGDPAEYASIRSAVGGPVRQKPVPIGSVKGHIGHTEGASGVIALVKVIMMMRNSFIPAQASFKKLNHRIEVRPHDMMEIMTSLRPWPERRKIALINNYGACGSNASMLVVQPPAAPVHDRGGNPSRLPFWITGLDWRSICAYSAKLASWLQRHVGGEEEATLADLSFAMSRQSNRGLPNVLIFSCSSVSELKEKLRQAASSTKDNALSTGRMPVKAERPVILCFGGQVSTFIELDRQTYDGVAVLRWHLDECDSAIRSAGLESIYPDIFSCEPVKDTVKLQTMLFALQYSCAKTWIDCGLEGKIAAVVGHSFGELTAICVAGVLSIEDAVQLVAGRARLVRDVWGADSGAMMAIDADQALVQDLLLETNRVSDGSAAIACYNGPRSFTIAGSTRSIVAAVEVLAGNNRFSGIKGKRLNVTNAFHSVLVDKIVDGLGQLGEGLTFNEPTIPVEHATEDSLTSKLDWTFVPSHMRRAVFFDHAIQRLAEKHPNAIFLEAGSSSTITVLAGRALAQRSAPLDAHFQAISLTKKGAIDALSDATVALWKQGLQVSFWPHHARQAREYAQLLLPPYQFDKAGRHWLEMKSPIDAINQAAEAIIKARGLVPATNDYSQKQHQDQDPGRSGLFSFVAYQDKKKRKKPRFQVSTLSDKYNRFFAGHVIAQTAPICPATLASDMAIEALFSLHPEWKAADLSPVLRDLVNHSPICADPSRAVYIDFKALDDSQKQWAMKMFSINATANNDVQTHVEAQLHFRATTDVDFIQEFARLERLVRHDRCQALLALGQDDERDDIDVLRGRNVYRAFRDVVDYAELYRGVRSVVGRGNESAGVVHKRHQGQTWLDTPLSDSFSQIGGMWVNLMTELSAGEMYIATGCEASMRSPKVQTATDGKDNGPGLWHVFAQHSRKSDKEYVTDIFVFDARDGTMTEAILGIQYTRVARESMRKMLTRLTKDKSVLRAIIQPSPTPVAGDKSANAAAAVPIFSSGNTSSSMTGTLKLPKKKRSRNESKTSRQKDITEDVRNLVASISGIEASEFTLDTEMGDLGIDSLMGMELAGEVERVFKCTIDQVEQMEATTLRKFVACVANALERAAGAGVGHNDEASESDTDDESSSSNEGSTSSRPSPNDVELDISTPNGAQSSPLGEKPTGPVLAADSAQSRRGTASNLTLPRSAILESFGEVKVRTDELMREHGLDTMHKTEIAGSNRLCTALVVEALEKLGMPLGAAAPGQELERVAFLPQHRRLMECIYQFLERDARLVDIDIESGRLTRTHITAPRKPSDAVLQGLLGTQPSFAVPNRITHYAGQRLADVLSGATDGIRVIFGTPQGRELVRAMYCDYTFNYMNYLQMRDVISHLASRIANTQPGETLKVLEMGAGTGGTTLVMAPLLATLDMPVEYTFTDLSASMVANARQTFGKQYPFMKFAVHDIEKPPAEEHRGQHIILASNAVHATHSLAVSVRNIRQALRPDGFLMLLEMTEAIPFVDLVFGLLEGWWLFDDGRKHAVVPVEHWEHELHAAGFGHVDWTDGNLPENAFQKAIIALATGPSEPEHLPKALPRAAGTAETIQLDRGDVNARELEAEDFVAGYTRGWDTAELDAARDKKTSKTTISSSAAVIIVTGATGSLGAHLVQQFAEQSGVATVVCVNRHSSTPADQRQHEAFNSRGIRLSPGAHRKLRVLETDTSKPQLGLPLSEYTWLAQNGTHIVHNAWPMSGTRPVKAFEPSFQALRNLLDLARSMATRSSSSGARIGFQLVSSIGVVGCAGEPRVLEHRVPMAAVLPGGYTEAKWACERMLDETLHRYPQLFRPMVVRPGQIAGSTVSGYWNPVEHFAFLVKSAQALRAWPDLDGTLQWLPVDQCARVMAELLKIGDEEKAAPDDAYPVYHIDNPVGQPWEAMSPVLAAALDIPPHSIIPFKAWIQRVRRSPLSAETENPAARVVDFLESHFERMSCGGLILDTQRAQQHSEAMAQQGPVPASVAQLYIASWKRSGFLRS